MPFLSRSHWLLAILRQSTPLASFSHLHGRVGFLHKIEKPIAGEKQAEQPHKFGIYVHSRFSMNMRYFVSHRQSRQGFISL